MFPSFQVSYFWFCFLFFPELPGHCHDKLLKDMYFQWCYVLKYKGMAQNEQFCGLEKKKQLWNCCLAGISTGASLRRWAHYGIQTLNSSLPWVCNRVSKQKRSLKSSIAVKIQFEHTFISLSLVKSMIRSAGATKYLPQSHLLINNHSLGCLQSYSKYLLFCLFR